MGENHFRNRKSIEIVLRAKNVEAQNTQCFTLLSVNHFFMEKVLPATTREARTVWFNTRTTYERDYLPERAEMDQIKSYCDM